MLIDVRYGPVDGAAEGGGQDLGHRRCSACRCSGKMLIGEVSWKNLCGPVTIADYAGQSAQLGLDRRISRFLALISISLGVLNLLPIPLLDGGHLMYYMVEIFKGSPVSERAMEIGQRIGLAVLLLSDGVRLLQRHQPPAVTADLIH